MKKLKPLMRVWALCSPYHRYILLNLTLMLIWQSVASAMPVFLGRMFTAVTAHDEHLFVVAILAWLGLALCRAVIYHSKERLEIKKLDFGLSRHMSQVSMQKFFSISMGQHHLGHSVIKKDVIRKGEAAVTGIVYQGVYELVPTLFTILLPTALLLVYAWQVGLCALVAIAVFATFTICYNSRFIGRIRALDTLSNQIGKKHGEAITNADVIYVNAQEERVKKECDDENAQQGTEGIPMWVSYVNWFYIGQWTIWIFQASCIAVSGYLAFNGKMTTGMFVTATWWIMSALGTLTNISHIQRNLAKNIGPTTKYFRFLDYEPDIVVPVKPVPIEHLLGRIEFRHVSFAYSSRTDKDMLNDEPDEEGKKGTAEAVEIPALKDVSFILDEGKRYAFVGRSGAGKSTLVGLILRAFDPQNGHVLVDGVDIRMLDYRELRKNIGLVPQDVALFDGTMRYNVTFGMNGSAEKITTDELDRVAKLSRISEFSDKLEKGWETMIGERGIKLSGGQRQRVGIARALIKNPTILIFDEATSSLDTENESRIRESINEASAGKTTIIIAHRLATVRDADKIFVFDEGKIVGQGSHEELLRSNEYYQRLVHNQVIMA
ncbi:MAG: ABC transporter ATP-binding protein [Candidatus Pacebacteria bacterium]|nr:ABC transporter ATP-binding protein [Candidatus Paceibacterota bacterium]